ncbi:MAG: hypothetical protein QOI10_20 [Solirubrobacterales bacterium]|jgi:hypothetical protein|nr:hypothetical protein [Solirubrobacterales bacterium]
MTMPRCSRALLSALAVAAVAVLAVAGMASARMSSQKLGPKLCETTGGGKFVAIPGFPGEMIDRRLLADIRWIEKRYPIFITDGYSMDAVHAASGEHPIGLAIDIVPNKAEGGTWNDIDALALWAEPKQNQPRAPFRWVGYDGDEGHGRGNHLHLSWSHSETKPGHPAALVDTVRCPDPIGGSTNPPPDPPDPPDEPTQPTGPTTGGAAPHGHHAGDPDRNRSRDRDHGARHDGHGSGGVSGKLTLAPPVPETDE